MQKSRVPTSRSQRKTPTKRVQPQQKQPVRKIHTAPRAGKLNTASHKMSSSRAMNRVQHVAGPVRSINTAAGIGNLGSFLKGKNALVTGSTSGIGLGIARQLAAHGANITLNGFGPADEIAKLQKDIASEFSVKVRYSGADMTKPAEIKKMVTDAQEAFGSLDILVNNAGIQHISTVQDFPEEKWDQVIAINLSAVFHASKAALPLMQKNGWGRIINISSVHGLVGSTNKSAYVASKHGVVGLTKVTALENAGNGVTVNTINPGWVLTPLVQKQIDLRAEKLGLTPDEARDTLLGEKQPSKQFVTVDDLGSMAVFLSSPYSNQMTGQCYVMDGGWTAQ